MQLQYTAPEFNSSGWESLNSKDTEELNPIINTFYVIGVNRLLYLQEGNKSFLYILELSQKLIMNLTTKNVNFLNGLVSFLWVTYSDCKSIIFEINDRLNRNSDNLKIYFYKYYVGSVRKWKKELHAIQESRK